MKRINVILTLDDEMLGTLPRDEDIYTQYIASKAPDAEDIKDEVERLGVAPVVEKGTTIFARDRQGNLVIASYMIKGFFKSACGAMRDIKGSESAKLKSYRKRIDTQVFVYPKLLPVTLAGDIDILQRPIRIDGVLGSHTAIASSERIPAGSVIEFQVKILNDEHEALVKEWLDYGIDYGIGQWRNAGKGCFSYEITSITSD
jgi:hypothetical protein